MNGKKIKKIFVECGLEGDSPKKSTNIFFPVAKAEFISSSWNIPQNKEFTACFTSKQAVNSFLYQKFDTQIDNLMCHRICAVGQSTAAYIKKVLPLFVQKAVKEVIYPKNEKGLFALLSELENNLKHNSHVVIFTSEIGKSKQILSEFLSHNLFTYEIVPLYTLVDLEIKRVNEYLTVLFQNENLLDSQFVFYCRSGYIVNLVVKSLITFFNVTTPHNLPPFLFFSTWEKSAREALLKLNLIDRDIS
ncbi:uroporphyrinogen-III synthase [Silvanigrella aquatica]|uniref:Tetrapyrrole biosynthesis uroporphyrinogen III synthase domain-containing protein n=1 Tax=Silvanigrella aquatica TaxID=1915309 RepID=A0A1L4D1G1_9BACT|nr:uroporphyrinogen-III synthase [Silvanigrella aquatica]APJ04031.1 hypothetical protein AXG55_08970 [Silvanigrella aquatica]